MATAESTIPINGSYAQPAYDAMASSYNAASTTSATGYSTSQQAPSSQQGSSASTSEIPKDEVGWYFVEQYYTTLSKSPEKLFLFYNKRSQFVSGTEEDKIQVCIGQKAINDQIKELDFHDTKVRVTNVDSQGSDANIVIQVIGEISNKGQPHKRFVQTFVLAEQTNGYFVLNDIFRYLAEEPEEEEEQLQQEAAPVSGVQEPAPTAAVPEAEHLNQSDEVAASEEDLVKVDQKLEDVVHEEPAREASPPAAVNGTPVPETAEVVPAEEAPAAAVSIETPTEEPEEPAMEETIEPEKPKDPSPTPAAPTPKPAPPAATPAAPLKPAAPRTWASLAASANKVATPNVPTPVTPQAPPQPKSSTTAPSQPLAVPAVQPSAPAREPSPANSQGETAGWETATKHKKEQSRAQNQAPTSEAESKRAYIKNVYSQVEEGALRSTLSKFGDIEYLDISRQKNCAFVDFKTATGFQNAVSNNPHTVNGVEIKVEERRLRPQSFAPYQRGGAPRGRGGMQGPRGGFQPRGGRGGPVGRGGRAAAQEA
ncbi:uncharacterized protein BDR25DRAFT_64334 [Lindgomyces ingoldianus]|uniref:Uncharacterized protein n=1 Tax=Lindgomyces ingoldianus TaxID=673940 RepID=A0ACB6RAH8_9PLEO|nr:uncharacterized protein BDR25DRAFT_64334 [Lindgomyces ingoldianus]KAF2476191.1 hypothetical protein BDR25DRAFT_64334 [Lindgomyces ingoldianus]